MGESSAAVSTALVVVDAPDNDLTAIESPQDVDAETMISVLNATRRMGIAISVGTVAPWGALAVLLAMIGEGVAVPAVAGLAALSIVFLVPILSVVFTRRAFLQECKSVGIPKRVATRIYRRLMLSNFRYEKLAPRDVRDRQLVAKLLKP